MILSNIKCSQCPDFYFQIAKEIGNIMANKECNHYEIYANINSFENNIFKDYKLGIKCKICKSVFNKEFKARENSYEYKCENCSKYPSLSFQYEVNDDARIFNTPRINYQEIIKKRGDQMNIKLFYNQKLYNHVVYSNDTLKDHYQKIRDKINFPDGKKILFNNNEVDQFKSFKENKIYNDMRLEIEE